jgi:tetratricopeptide (TPR) repeat protein
MLPPIREFAVERADPFDLATIRRRHLKWCTEQVQAADFGTTRDGRAYARHVLDDVHAALAWALSSAQPDLVDAAATLLVESRPVLEHSPASLDPAWKFTQLALRSGDVLSGPAHGRLRHLAGRLVYLLGRTHEVRPHLEVARALLSTVDDPDDRARLADIDVGLISAMEALLDPACLTAAEAAIGSAEGHVDKGVLAFMFADLANVFSEWGRTGEAYAMLHRAQQLDDLDPVSSPLITRTVSIPVHDGDPRHALDAGLPILAQSEKTAPNALIEVFVYCGWAYAGLGDFAAARQHIDRGIELARSTRPIHEGYAQLAAADTERLAGRSAAQRRSLRACLRFGLISFDLRSAVRAVWLSALMAEECRSGYAARLAAASLVIRELTGLPAWPLEEPVFQRWRDAVPAPGEAGPDRHNTIIHSIELALEFIET